MKDRLKKWLAEQKSEIDSNEITGIVFDAIESAIGGMIITNMAGKIIYVNKALLKMFGYTSRRELLGFSAPALFTSHHIMAVSDIMFSSENGISDFSVIRKDGSHFFVTLTTSPVHNDHGEQRGTMISLYDISKRRAVEQELRVAKKELQEANRKLTELASIDPLTGLANRRTFDLHLENEWRRCSRMKIPLSLLFIDVDYFKRYNDHYGHQMGDTCLREIAAILKNSGIVGRASDLIARYGGEEFAVILPGAVEADAVHCAELLLLHTRASKIEHHGTLVEQEHIVTLSIGVATEIDFLNGNHLDLLRSADKALYTAKEDGRDKVALFRK